MLPVLMYVYHVPRLVPESTLHSCIKGELFLLASKLFKKQNSGYAHEKKKY